MAYGGLNNHGYAGVHFPVLSHNGPGFRMEVVSTTNSSSSPMQMFSFGMAPIQLDEMLITGGSYDFAFLNSTWIFNLRKKTWRQVALGSSLPRMKYPVVAKINTTHLVMFGGQSTWSTLKRPVSKYETRTWLYSHPDDSWTPLQIHVSPPPREKHSLVWTKRGVLLFGGNMNGEKVIYNDTWLFTNNTWHEIYPAHPLSPWPEGRYEMSMASNGTHALMHGGAAKSGIMGDTWVFTVESMSWARLTMPPSGDKSVMGSMIYLNSKFLRMGGMVRTQIANQVRVWNGRTWELTNFGPRPDALKKHTMVRIDDNVVMIGGLIDGGDAQNTRAWKYSQRDRMWTIIYPFQNGTQPSVRTFSAGTFLSPGKAVFFGGYYTNKNYDDTYILTLTSTSIYGFWERVTTAIQPMGRTDHAMASLFDHEAVVLFGGAGYRTLFDDTWVFSGVTKTWTKIEASIYPSGRQGASMAARGGNQALLFGGYKGKNFYGDLWEFDYGTQSWRDITGPRGQIPMRRRHGLFAPLHTPNAFVLFGGINGNGENVMHFTETWVLWFDPDGNRHWQLVKEETSPANTEYGAIAPIGAGSGVDSTLYEVVIAGGELTDNLNSQGSYFFVSSRCPLGTQLTTDKNNCEFCPVGTYNEYSTLQCIACPQGTSTYSTGAVAKAECSVCAVGDDSAGVCALLFSGAQQYNCFPGAWGDQCQYRCPGFDPAREGISQPRVCGGNFKGICSEGTTGSGKCQCSILFSLTLNDDCTYPLSGILFAAVLLLIVVGIATLAFYRKRQQETILALVKKEDQLLEASLQLRQEQLELQQAQEGWSIQESEVTLKEKVASGSYGDVYRGQWVPLKDVPVAVKVVFPTSGGDIATLDDSETLLMQRIRNPRLVLFFGAGVFKSLKQSFMVTEFMAGGDLMDFIKTAAASGDYDAHYPWKLRVRNAMDIAEGMEFLHSRNWVHRDLKSANVLRDEMGRCKITDFGLSKSLSGRDKAPNIRAAPSSKGARAPRKLTGDFKIEMTAFTGSGPWLAPELITKRFDEVAVGGKKVDIYSFSCVLYELVEGKMPWFNATSLEDIFSAVEQGHRPKLSKAPAREDEDRSKARQKLCALMSRCWQQSPNRRPSFASITEELSYIYRLHFFERERIRARSSARFTARGSSQDNKGDVSALLSYDSIARPVSFANPVAQTDRI